MFPVPQLPADGQDAKSGREPLLKAGEWVCVIAPSSGLPEQDYNESIRYLKGLGLEVVVPEDLIHADLIEETDDDPFSGFYANVLEKRAQVLADAIADPRIKVILNLAGGTGGQAAALRARKILEERHVNPATRKLHVGFSDGTMINQILGEYLLPVYGPGLTSLRGRRSFRELFEDFFLKDRQLHTNIPLIPVNDAARGAEKISGHVCGGLTYKLDMLREGPFAFSPGKDDIVLLETLTQFFGMGETPEEKCPDLHRLESVLSKAGAIIIGRFSGSGRRPHDSMENLMAHAAPVIELLRGLDVPVFFGYPMGHLDTTLLDDRKELPLRYVPFADNAVIRRNSVGGHEIDMANMTFDFSRPSAARILHHPLARPQMQRVLDIGFSPEEISFYKRFYPESQEQTTGAMMMPWLTHALLDMKLLPAVASETRDIRRIQISLPPELGFPVRAAEQLARLLAQEFRPLLSPGTEVTINGRDLDELAARGRSR